MPFVGASGKLLDAVLGNFGVERDSVLLTNACSCDYPRSLKEIPKEAVEACRPRLIAELAEAGTTTVVAMGNTAIRSIMPKDMSKKGVTKLRAGPPKKVKYSYGVTEPHPLPVELKGLHMQFEVVPTFHPAACLRSQANFPLMLGDIAKAVTPASERAMMWYEPNVIVIDETYPVESVLELVDNLKELNKNYGLVVDTESGRDKDISFGRDEGPYGRVLCIGIGGLHRDDEHSVYVFTDRCLDDIRIRDAIKLALNECGVIAQNGKYDIGVLMNYLDQDEPFPLLSDTMLASYALYEVGGIHGLDYMGQEVLGAPNWKDDVKPYISKDQGYATIPREMLYKYNAYDVHVTRLLHGYFQNLIEEHGLNSLNTFLLRVSRMLTLVERRGMGFDEDVARALEAEYDAEIARIELTMPTFEYTTKKETKEVRLNPNSWQQLMQWLLENEIQTESTDEDHLEEILQRRGKKKPSPLVVETIGKVLESRKVSKSRGTYVTGPLAKRTSAGRVHTSYLLHGTTTGRLSSRGPNLQNIPRKGPVKTQYIPHKGNTLIQCDYSQAELRVITWLAKEEGFRDLFNDPTKDIFIELCKQIIPGYADLDPKDPNYTEGRTLIKTFAYGIAYGRTAEGIAADPNFKMSVSEARRQKDLFDARIPRIKSYQQEIIDIVHRGEDLVNPFGRHRRFYLITDSNRSSVENEAMAFMPQSTASDINLEAACRLSDEGVYIVNLVHDANIAECKPDEVDEIAVLMDRVMCEVAHEVTEGYVTFATDCKIGDRWSEIA